MSATGASAATPTFPAAPYTLRMKGANSAGVWNEAGDRLKITVIPPFWETWPFRGLLLLVLAGVIAGAYRWRVAASRAAAANSP